MHRLGNWRSHSHHRTRYPAWSSACCRFQPWQSNSFNWDFKCIKVQLLGLLGFWLPEPFPSFPFIKDMNWVPETRSVKVLMASVFPVSPCLSSRCSRKQTAALWANETDFTLLTLQHGPKRLNSMVECIETHPSLTNKTRFCFWNLTSLTNSSMNGKQTHETHDLFARIRCLQKHSNTWWPFVETEAHSWRFEAHFARIFHTAIKQETV